MYEQSIRMQIANGGLVGDDAFVHNVSDMELVKARREYRKIRNAALTVCARLGLDWTRAVFDHRVMVNANGYDDAYVRATTSPIAWVDAAHSLFRDLQTHYADHAA